MPELGPYLKITKLKIQKLLLHRYLARTLDGYRECFSLR